MTHYPLTPRSTDDIIAWRHGQPVAVGQLLAEAEILASRLPAGIHGVNRCHNRYRFMRAFLAVLMAGQTNLLPPDRLTATTRRLLSDYPGSYVLTDDPESAENGAVISAVLTVKPAQPMDTAPSIDGDHLAAIAFTSGSSGQPKPVPKPWHTLYESTRINTAAMGLAGKDPRNLLATVPPQHMYGLETSVLNPLLGSLAASQGRPLLPADIQAGLAALPEPRVLVTTPAHLSSLDDPQLTLPPIETIWSATAPLDTTLARRIEQRHATRVHEIYGFSEVGSLAQRRPVHTDTWRVFPGFTLRESAPEGLQAEAPHLPSSHNLPDRVSRQGNAHFCILGRGEDLINVAGKRASLRDLNQRLLALPGVQDGVIFPRPNHDHGTATRLAAMVVAPNRDATSLCDDLRREIEEAFLPRPIYHVAELPRSETGKLPRNALLERLAAIEGNAPGYQEQA
jgi:acyl-coenzyme A synthetase/AMP-(fatty) acid ligase